MRNLALRPISNFEGNIRSIYERGSQGERKCHRSCSHFISDVLVSDGSMQAEAAAEVKKVVAELKTKGATAVGLTGFCWGGASLWQLCPVASLIRNSKICARS